MILPTRAIDGRSAWLVLPLREGACAFCRECGGETRLVDGFGDARAVVHAIDCRVGRVMAGRKPVLLRWKAGEKAAS
jgi:hypothetical protein